MCWVCLYMWHDGIALPIEFLYDDLYLTSMSLWRPLTKHSQCCTLSFHMHIHKHKGLLVSSVRCLGCSAATGSIRWYATSSWHCTAVATRPASLPGSYASTSLRARVSRINSYSFSLVCRTTVDPLIYRPLLSEHPDYPNIIYWDSLDFGLEFL